MNSRQRVCDTLEHRKVDRPPRHLWTLPYISMFRQEELARLQAAFPSDFTKAPFQNGPSFAKGTPNVRGCYTDAFGCRWSVAEDGVAGEVKEPILPDYDALDKFELPWEMLRQRDLSEVDDFCRNTDRFVLQGTSIRPFERMQFLRGTENLFMDIALEEPGFLELRDRLHAFYLAELDGWCATAVDGISFMDDWGSQRSTLISPDAWRKYFKPLYQAYCSKIHAAGKFAFFHSDGNIQAIYPDLVEIGVDAVNSQLFCMDMEELGRQFAGKITFWGEIDRQHILPFGTPEDVRNAVSRVANAMRAPELRSGVIAQCEWSKMDSYENIAAVFEAWNQIFTS